jgi:hypothetical protein
MRLRKEAACQPGQAASNGEALLFGRISLRASRAACHACSTDKTNQMSICYPLAYQADTHIGIQESPKAVRMLQDRVKRISDCLSEQRPVIQTPCCEWTSQYPGTRSSRSCSTRGYIDVDHTRPGRRCTAIIQVPQTVLGVQHKLASTNIQGKHDA